MEFEQHPDNHRKMIVTLEDRGEHFIFATTFLDHTGPIRGSLLASKIIRDYETAELYPHSIEVKARKLKPIMHELIGKHISHGQ